MGALSFQLENSCSKSVSMGGIFIQQYSTISPQTGNTTFGKKKKFLNSLLGRHPKIPIPPWVPTARVTPSAPGSPTQFCSSYCLLLPQLASVTPAILPPPSILCQNPSSVPVPVSWVNVRYHISHTVPGSMLWWVQAQMLSFILFSFVFLKQSFAPQLWLAWDLQWSSCRCPPSARITGISYHTWLLTFTYLCCVCVHVQACVWYAHLCLRHCFSLC